MIKRLLFLLLAFYVYNASAQTCNAVSIYFKPNECSLANDNIIEIKRVLAAASTFKISAIVIEGRSDSIGSVKTNLVLSKKRIDATLRTLKPLLNKNIRIQTINHGESNPVSLTNLDKNRSVKITFILDTLVNLAKQGEGEIWLNTKLLTNIDSCNFAIFITPYLHNRYNYIYSSYIPLSEKIGTAYEVRIFNSCFGVYIFPDSFYDPITHIGRFDPPLDLWYCTHSVDSLKFSYNNEQIQYDSLSQRYYLIVNCQQRGGVCCATRPNCTSLTFVPEAINTHTTALRFFDFDDNIADTIFVSDSLVWQDWNCLSTEDSAYVYSIAMFDSTYYYLKGEIDQFRKKDTLSFKMNGEEYKYNSASKIYFLERNDYTSFSSPTNKPIIIKAKRGYTPGYYIKEYDVIIPFEHVRGKRYKGYAIDYPTEFGLQQNQTILWKKELNVKRKVKKSNTVIRLKPLKQ